jgi:hypothetical protein
LFAHSVLHHDIAAAVVTVQAREAGFTIMLFNDEMIAAVGQQYLLAMAGAPLVVKPGVGLRRRFLPAGRGLVRALALGVRWAWVVKMFQGQLVVIIGVAEAYFEFIGQDQRVKMVIPAMAYHFPDHGVGQLFALAFLKQHDGRRLVQFLGGPVDEVQLDWHTFLSLAAALR